MAIKRIIKRDTENQKVEGSEFRKPMIPIPNEEAEQESVSEVEEKGLEQESISEVEERGVEQESASEVEETETEHKSILSKFKPLPRIGSNRSRSKGTDGIGIVCAETGNRISLPRKLYNQMHNPAYIDFSCDEKVLIIYGVNEDEGGYAVSESGNRFIVYSKPLVEQIVKQFNLTQYQQRTSATFDDYHIELPNSKYPIVMLTLKA